MNKKFVGFFILVLVIFINFSVLANDNQPPTIPIIEGTAMGVSGEEYWYSFNSTDPDGDDVSYCIDWGCGSPEFWIGPCPCGEEQYDSHRFAEGSYTIRAKAKDINGAESEWGTFEISMPKIRIYNQVIIILFRLIGRFPVFEFLLFPY